jgi:phosphoglycerol transferase MdoB-like AlkP superfamily enzyme
MQAFRSLLRPDEKTGAAMRWAHRLWVFLWLTVFGLGIGLLSLYLAAYSCPGIDAQALWASYFKLPLLVVMNLLMPLLLVYLGFFLFARPWAAYLLSAVPFLTLALANYYKIQLRGDPVLASDLRLLRTAGGIMGNYSFELSAPVGIVAAGFVTMLLLSILLLRREHMSRHERLAGLMLLLSLTLAGGFELYPDADIYEKTANSGLINPWSETEIYVSRGTTYPFLYSVQDMLPNAPSGYRESEASSTLASYEDQDIPEGEKITVVGIMLEAFSDMTDFPVLDEVPAIHKIYEPLHELEERSVSGRLLTNIFAGGTVDTEWGYLTGYSEHEEFRSPVNTYVRYFKSQGYDALYRHPGYSWFYNRSNVNEYLGFDECVFNDTGFGDLISISDALYHSDKVLVDYLLNDIDSRTETDDPLFLFSVSYQNHGPYPSETYWEEYVTPEKNGWSMQTCCVINNYLAGIRSTINEMCRMTEELEGRDEPIVFVFFGDHKPWMGNGNSVYTEMGINMDVSTLDGFYNYYATPYVIYANQAARDLLGSDFAEPGGDFSPCFLMAKVFDECGWEGPGFMQLQREMRAVSPLMSSNGWRMQNGQLTMELDGTAEDENGRYLRAQYYIETHLKEDAL